MIEYRRLGSSGLQLPIISYGTALTIGTEHVSPGYTDKLISTCWDGGIRSFDTSNNYSNGLAEELLGKTLRRYARESFVLSTKGSWPIGDGPYNSGLGRKHLRHALDDSLKRLQCEYVDIYYAHRFDPNVELEEVVKTFNYFIDQQKILYWATSEWPADEIERCVKICDDLKLQRPICDQHILSYAVNKNITNGLKDICDLYKLGRIAYSPLCQGYLTGKYSNCIPAESRIAKSKKIGYYKTQNFYNQFSDKIDYFNKMCLEFSVCNEAAALQWVQRQNSHIVMGATSVEQVENNIAAFNEKLPKEFWEKLECQN